MKSTMGWILAGLFALVLMLVLIPGIFMFSRGFGGMMGGYGMMGRGFGYTSSLGWLGMALFTLIPIGFLVLLVLGGVWVVSSLMKSGKTTTTVTPAVASKACSSCGKSVQSDWKVCPFCGNSLS
jgi:uncharacterized membrane protein